MWSPLSHGNKVDWMENIHNYTISKGCTWFEKKKQQLCLQNLQVSQAQVIFAPICTGKKLTWLCVLQTTDEFCAPGPVVSLIKWLALVWCHSVCCYYSWSQFLLRQLLNLPIPQLPTTEIGLSAPGTELNMSNWIISPTHQLKKDFIYYVCFVLLYVYTIIQSYVLLLPLILDKETEM